MTRQRWYCGAAAGRDTNPCMHLPPMHFSYTRSSSVLFRLETHFSCRTKMRNPFFQVEQTEEKFYMGNRLRIKISTRHTKITMNMKQIHHYQ